MSVPSVFSCQKLKSGRGQTKAAEPLINLVIAKNRVSEKSEVVVLLAVEGGLPTEWFPITGCRHRKSTEGFIQDRCPIPHHSVAVLSTSPDTAIPHILPDIGEENRSD
jgi:hypothetical protein